MTTNNDLFIGTEGFQQVSVLVYNNNMVVGVFRGPAMVQQALRTLIDKGYSEAAFVTIDLTADTIPEKWLK